VLSKWTLLVAHPALSGGLVRAIAARVPVTEISHVGFVRLTYLW